MTKGGRGSSPGSRTLGPVRNQLSALHAPKDARRAVTAAEGCDFPPTAGFCTTANCNRKERMDHVCEIWNPERTDSFGATGSALIRCGVSRLSRGQFYRENPGARAPIGSGGRGGGAGGKDLGIGRQCSFPVQAPASSQRMGPGRIAAWLIAHRENVDSARFSKGGAIWKIGRAGGKGGLIAAKKSCPGVCGGFGFNLCGILGRHTDGGVIGCSLSSLLAVGRNPLLFLPHPRDAQLDFLHGHPGYPGCSRDLPR